MKECNIIKDLFPSYIDGLTNEETNQYIEKHLSTCEECKKILEEMKKDLKFEETSPNSKEVKYIKKFNKKIRILKVIIICIILIMLLSLARKMIIFANINKIADNYTSSTNFYMKEINYGGATEDINIYETYVKDNKYLVRAKMKSEFSKVKGENYYNGEKLNRYVETEYVEEDEKHQSSKKAYLNYYGEVPFPIIWNELDFKNSIQIHGIALVFSNITSEICNQKECYRVSIPSLKGGSSTIYYVDKETGLTIRIIGGRSIDVDGKRYDSVADFKYSFDCVTDEVFIEPDISKYQIEEEDV